MRVIALWLILLCSAPEVFCASPYFEIEVVDEQTGRGVPMVELETNNGISHWTDSNGLIAFNEPGLMNGPEVWFHVASDGYSYPKDGFGNAGVRLKPRAGGFAQVKVKRENVAERMYRITGQGIYRDTTLLGRKAPIAQANLNGEILGQDSVITAIYNGKLYLFWGDTDRAAYPLGNFSATGATMDLPGRGGLNPAVGINLNYFTGKDGFAAPMCPDFGKGLQWLESAFTVKDPSGRERLIARVSSQEGLKAPYAWHLAVWNDDKNHFESLHQWPGAKMHHDTAHAFRASVNGTNYIYVYPNYRVQADWHAVTNLARYEAFACIAAENKADRDATGKLVWKWRAGADRLHVGAQREHIKNGDYKREEAWMRAVDVENNEPVDMDRGSVRWNEFRKRWVMIGWVGTRDIYYSEALSPTGPWEYARRVVAHKAYTFYNPVHHGWADDGKWIYFEATYTAAFSAAKEKTPRYDYNQIMYRLDLTDPRLKLPAPKAAPFESPAVTKPSN